MATSILKFELAPRAFQEALKDWAAVSKMGFLDALREQSKQLALRLINGPVNRETGGRGIATPPETKKQGEAAVERDIYRAVFPLRAANINDPKLRSRVNKMVLESDQQAIRMLVERGALGSHLKGATVTPFHPQLHEGQRNKRGVVPKSTERHPKFITWETDKLDAYVKHKKQFVGMAKGGWAAAAIHLGGKVTAWIRRHAAQGSFEDRLKPGVKDPSFTMTNRSPWTNRDDTDRVVGEAMEGREMQMRKQIEKILNDGWNKTQSSVSRTLAAV